MENNTMTIKKNSPLDGLFKAQEDTFANDYGTIVDFYLSGTLGQPSEYITWFQQIRSARESDVLRFHINCPGGDLFTTIQFMQVLSETPAHVLMSVEGACMSAATLIFLMGDEFYITDHSVFLFHNYSGGVVGKGGEMYHGMVHERKWTERLFRQSYTDFLTADEMAQLTEDKDVWMDASVVIERLKANAEEPAEDAQPTPKKKTAKKKTAKKKTS